LGGHLIVQDVLGGHLIVQDALGGHLIVQRFSTFFRPEATLRPGATFTLSYRLADRKVINENNLLIDHGILLKLLNYAFCCKQVHILLKIIFY
jgi:hypothetical protein